MKQECFFKNRISSQRNAVAGGLSAVFVVSTVGSSFAEVAETSCIAKKESCNEVFDLKEQDLKAKRLTYLAMSFLAIIPIIILIFGLCSESTQESSKKTTDPDNGDEQRSVKKQGVEQSFNKILDGAKIVGRTLAGTGVGVATTALVKSSSKGRGTTFADSKKKAKSTGRDGVVEAVALQGSNVDDGIQSSDKDADIQPTK